MASYRFSSTKQTIKITAKEDNIFFIQINSIQMRFLIISIRKKNPHENKKNMRIPLIACVALSKQCVPSVKMGLVRQFLSQDQRNVR